MSRQPQNEGAKHSATDAIVSQSLDDLLVPGVIVEVTPDEADRLGAFEEDALGAGDAWDANLDQ